MSLCFHMLPYGSLCVPMLSDFPLCFYMFPYAIVCVPMLPRVGLSALVISCAVLWCLMSSCVVSCVVFTRYYVYFVFLWFPVFSCVFLCLPARPRVFLCVIVFTVLSYGSLCVLCVHVMLPIVFLCCPMCYHGSMCCPMFSCGFLWFPMFSPYVLLCVLMFP